MLWSFLQLVPQEVLQATLTTCINAPAVHMERDVMILMRANPLLEPVVGVGPENRDFFGP